MNFTVQQSSLLNILYLASGIVDKKGKMPILGNVKISANENKLSITASDLSISLFGTCDAIVEGAMSTTVDAKVIYDIVRELPDNPVTFNFQGGDRIEISCEHIKFKISGTSSDEYPAVAGVEIVDPISVSASKLFEMFEKTVFSICVDETRQNINGLCVECIDGISGKQTLRFVASDGYRLTIIDRPAEGLSFENSVILPRKGVQEIQKVINNNDGVALVSLRHGFFSVKSGDVTIGVRLIDGTFPEYRNTIPQNPTCEVVARIDSLSAALRRVSLVTSDKNKTTRFQVIGGSLFMSSSSSEFGEASESIAVEKQGEDLTIGFSARYVLEVLSALKNSKNIIIKFHGEEGPGLFLDENDELFKCFLMPMRFDHD